MELFNFGRDTATRIEVHDAVGATQVKLGSSTGEAHLNIVYLEPGGLLGEHPAPTPQLFIVVGGNGWVSGDDGYRKTVRAGVGVFWSEGERHASGTDTDCPPSSCRRGSWTLPRPQAVCSARSRDPSSPCWNGGFILTK